MKTDEHLINYYDQHGNLHTAVFKTGEYDNLMMLLLDKYYEEWGDCKGRAWCGTCHIRILDGTVAEEIDQEESVTLSNLNNATLNSRLACQIPVDDQLNNFTFQIMEYE